MINSSYCEQVPALGRPNGSTSHTDAHESIESHAHMFGAQSLHDASASKSICVESAPASRFAYVHPHVHWKEANALMHRIDFSDSDSAAARGESHFSLVACPEPYQGRPQRRGHGACARSVTFRSELTAQRFRRSGRPRERPESVHRGVLWIFHGGG